VSGSVLPEDVLRDAPSYTPHAHELADLELLLSGAYAPLTGFLGRADLNSLRRRGRLADGTQWPVPVTLEVPAELASDLVLEDPLHRTIILTDPEGAPVAARSAGWATAATARSSGCGAPRPRSGPCCHPAGCSA
jgi:sulfate adenylyltransferase